MVPETLQLSEAMKETHAWLQNYCSTTAVQGWMNPGIANFLRLAGTATENMPGGALEIGVHHGKFFIAINSLVRPTDASVAIDLFEQGQAQNIDGSGRGNLAQFKANLLQHDRHGGSNVSIYEADSTTLTPADILALSRGEKFRIVSIDGGHTAEHTISDLKLAERVVSDFGFVFVDDFLNAHWLGVIDGVVNYLQSRPILWPVALGYNKLLMCRMSAHPRHFPFFKKNHDFRKTTRLCGYDILAI